MRSTKRILIITVIFMTVIQVSLNAQYTNSVFFMPNVPQSHRVNPAIQPGCSFYMGLPVASPLRLQLSSGLAYQDIFYHDTDLDSLLTPFHPMRDKQAFLNLLDGINYEMANFGINLASIGFRSGKSFLSFDISTRIDGNFYFPDDLYNLAYSGFADGSTVSLGGFGANISAFNEFAFGWSRQDFLIPNFTFGVRGKLLFGLANFQTSNSSLDISSSRESWNIQSQMEYNISAPPFVEFSDNIDDGLPVSINDDFLDGATPLDIAKNTLPNIFSFDQFGMAADVGIDYQPIPQLRFSASLLDIGGINHKNTLQSSFDFEYDFEGIEVNPFTGVDTVFISTLTDSLINSLSFIPGEPYFSRLNSKLLIGLSYYPIKRIGFGVLSRTDFLSEKMLQQFTGTVNLTTGRHINLTFSYSYISNTFNNMGAGISLVLRPFNLYLISDNAISAALKPLEARSLNLWFGMNLTFGWKRVARKQKAVDKPLIL